jgi:hypothetical protein
MRANRVNSEFRVFQVFLAALGLMARMVMLVPLVRTDLLACVGLWESLVPLASAVRLELLALPVLSVFVGKLVKRVPSVRSVPRELVATLAHKALQEMLAHSDLVDPLVSLERMARMVSTG